MKIGKLFEKIEKFCEKSIDKSSEDKEKRAKLKRIISIKIKKTKSNIKKSDNDLEINKFNKKLKILKKLSKKVDF